MIWTHFKQLSLLAFLAIFTLLLYRRALKRKPVGTKPVNTKTFRIRGVPVDWDDERLESFLTEHCSPSIPKVKSLADQANDGCRDGTVMFQSADPPKRILLPKSSRGPSSPDRWLTLDQDFFGVTALYTPPAKDHILDVIAIAGLGGHAFGSFKEKNGHHMWLRDSLPYDLTHGDAGRPMARIMTYGYESSLAQSKNMQNLEDLAASFRDGLLALARSPTPKPIILIAHSLGGLIVKQALITLSQPKTEEHERLIRAVYGIVFFGVPHDGMDIGSLRAMVRDYSNRFLVESLNRINSQTLNALRRGFHTALGKGGDSEIFCFYETLDSPTVQQNRHGKWAMTGPGTILVAQTSATHCRDWEDGSQHVCAIARSHSDLVKFGPQDNEYDKVREKLRALARRAIKPHRLGRYYYVPLETVETYIQRDELWQELVEKMQLRNENASVPHATAIIGLGGTGKSQLALRYAEQHRDRFNPILWIDATDEEAVRLSFEKCAAKLGLSVDRTTGQASAVADAAAVQTVLQWLENREDTNDQWLVITDNADDFDWGVQKIVPKGKRGNIIITSRDNLAPRLVSGCCEVQVGLMSPQEGRELLLHYLKGDVQPDAVEVRELCDEVVQRLGHLALAIGLAGAHISTYNERVPEKCLRQYLTDYDRHRDQLLRMNRLSGLSATKATIWTVWDTTLEKIEKEYESFKPILLLSFLAQFKGAIVQDELFRLAAWGWDSFLYRESRDVLLRYNLIQRAEGDWPGSTMHQLVQWRARQSHLHRPWPYWYMAFISAACRQVIEERHRPEFRRHLIAHIPEITQDYLEEWGGTFGTFYLDEGRWEDAENIYVQVLEIRKAKLGADHPDTLTSMGNLASTYWNQGRWEDAEGLEVQVLEISKEKFGVDDPDTLTTLTFRDQGRLEDAEGLQAQVLKLRKAKLGADHPATLTSMNNLAFTWESQGRHAEA
ncbi:Kinesin light chain 4, partial [Tolypocladium ophioglossoides CBS 100239]